MADPVRLQLKITLEHVEPAVWRRVVVSDSLTFLQLHDVIQRAMGWEDCHMHEFELAGPRIRIGTDEPDGFMDFGDREPCLPERKTRLADVLAGKRKLRYWYDFGDDWWHTIAIEKRLPADSAAVPAELIAGENACPPEDCGGPWGYEEMLAAAADPAHPEHGEIRDWLGDEFDPTAFDLPRHAKAVASSVRKRRR
ncbi:MAG: plasmid pRiA4b ORF-3 family protein [Sterolibacteriaceae bacterium]|uniref:Plasmid pRiA4b ORF-3 family protein n=1 Tax=Candidatus Methylophosphatis roskildensis TaxID=2899263 RepID=A0A9D7HTE4_9PROT|nr:plasmid pRiA4b ORF-3 family protein [Candidatus Methylophosphatis roskildensis]MBK7238359.1 plasmid pRiA4b ORF-3 family protein [Sterolibacteriaceae bacterium]